MKDSVTVHWERTSPDFHFDRYNREHRWVFPSGQSVEASAGLAFGGKLTHVNPEEGFVASVSSCHMLTFLAIAARKRFVVERYTDRATGVLEKNENGIPVVTRVTLRPEVVFGGDRLPTAKDIHGIHRSSHRHCFIAQSIKSEVVIEPVGVDDA